MNRLTLILAVVFCMTLLRTGRTEPPAQPNTRPAGEIAAGRAPQSRALNKPLRLFNGRDLDGFYSFLRKQGKDADPEHVFSVADGMIRVSGAEWGCLTTRDEYENYHLLVEYKWGQAAWPPRVKNARDSGILLHSVGKDGAYGGVWMYSIECQLIEGGTGDLLVVGDGTDRYSLTASVCKEKSAGCYVYDPTGAGELATIHQGRLNWFARDPAWRDVKGFRGKNDVERPIGEWNRLECLAVADRIVVKLNGVLVNSCRDVRPRRGRIQIQSEGAEIFVRRADLTPVQGEPSALIQRFSPSSRPSR